MRRLQDQGNHRHRRSLALLRQHVGGGAEGKTFASIDDAQMELDAWVHHYNFERPHQSLGMAVPWDRFRLVKADPAEPDEEVVVEPQSAAPPAMIRRVGKNGLISSPGRTTGPGCGSAARTSA